MKYEYTHFIPENVAPKGATRIVVKNGDEEVASIPASRFGSLTPPTGELLYSIGWVSDCHTCDWTTAFNGSQKLRNALSYFQRAGCKFVIGCGDFTQTGFYCEDATDYNEGQMLNYQSILADYSIPVYEIFGNHENFYGVSITKHLARAKELTGIPYTAYTVSNAPDSDTVEGTTTRPNRCEPSVGNDLYIMIGQSESSKQPMSTSDLEWLEYILNANTNRRCFVVIHSFIDDNVPDGIEDSGNPCFAQENSIFGYWGTASTAEFLNMMSRYPKAILFHGHSHMKFESQEFDKCANYTDKNGFESVHVPSLGSPRHLLNTNGDWTTIKGADRWTEPESQCYLVDVYSDCIVLNGLELGTTGVPSVEVLGTLKINT